MLRRRMTRLKTRNTGRGLRIVVLTLLLFAVTVSITTNSIYYNYTYNNVQIAYSSSINTLNNPQLPITRPSHYYLVSDVNNPGDTAYVRGVILYNNTDKFNQTRLIVYLEEPDICIPFWNTTICLASITSTVSLYDDSNNLIFTNTTTSIYVFNVISNNLDAIRIIDVNIQSPVPINSTKAVKVTVQCNIGC